MFSVPANLNSNCKRLHALRDQLLAAARGVLAEQAHARSRAALRGPRRDADGFRRLGHLVP